MSLTRAWSKQVTNYGKRTSIGSRLRSKRIIPLLRMIESVYEEHGFVSIIDIGGTEKYWTIVPSGYLDKHNVSITIANLPRPSMKMDHGPFKFIEADGCDLAAFDDKTFHIAHSNSVLEHVGDWDRMTQFANETSRVSEKYFVQTPNYWFPIEPHCMIPLFHWLPKPTRIWLVQHAELGHWKKADSTDEAVHTVESARLLNRKMFNELFNEGHVITERFYGLPKSFIAIKN